MKRFLVPLFALLFPVIGLAESYHAHQFTEEGCCESLCPGAAAIVRGEVRCASFIPPQPAETGFSRVLPFFAPKLLEKDIFHPPLP